MCKATPARLHSTASANVMDLTGPWAVLLARDGLWDKGTLERTGLRWDQLSEEMKGLLESSILHREGKSIVSFASFQRQGFTVDRTASSPHERTHARPQGPALTRQRVVDYKGWWRTWKCDGHPFRLAIARWKPRGVATPRRRSSAVVGAC